MMTIEEIDWFVQQALIKEYLPYLKVKFSGESQVFSIDFSIKLPNTVNEYRFVIFYKPVFMYQVQIFQPLLFCMNNEIVRHIDNHINVNGQICYFYPGDLNYKEGVSCLYAMQAAIKWADCYNYWSKNPLSAWPSAEMPHGSYVASYFGIERPIL